MKLEEIEFTEVEAVPVEAEVVEDAPANELVVSRAVPGSVVEANFGAVKAYVDAQLAEYGVEPIHEEGQYAQAKRDRTALRKMISGIDAERKKVKEAYTAPLAEFEQRVKDILEPAKLLENRMKDAIGAYEEDWRDARRKVLRDAYADYAPAIALPLEGQDAPLVPFDRIEDASWLKRDLSEGKAVEAMRAKVDGIAEGEALIASLSLPKETEAKAEYFRTLDAQAAISHAQELQAAEDRAHALERQRKEQEAAQAQEPVPQPAQAAPEPAREPQQMRIRVESLYVFYDMTDEQKKDLVAACRRMGIHGRPLETRRVEVPDER